MKTVAMKKDSTSIQVPEETVASFEKKGWRKDATTAAAAAGGAPAASAEVPAKGKRPAQG